MTERERMNFILLLVFVFVSHLIACGGGEKQSVETTPKAEREPSEVGQPSPVPNLAPVNGVKPLRLREEGPTVEGGLELGRVQYRLRSKLPGMEACLDQELGQAFRGVYRFTLSFEIQSQGKVNALQLETAADAIKACHEVFMSLIGQIDFGQSESGASTKVVYPFEVSRGVL
jgi:hypothetical protein